jgi:hypothetical protein
LRSNGRPGRAQLKQLIKAVNQFMKPPDPPTRPIGFLAQVEKGKKAPGGKTQDPTAAPALAAGNREALTHAKCQLICL